MASSSSSIDLIIRFSSSLPDITLPISSPTRISTLTLKQLLRPYLPSPSNNARLRFIHAGKVLPDTTALATALNIPPAPPQSTSAKAKGKLPILPPPKIYIHCSIADTLLSSSELDAEATAARDADAAIVAQTSQPAISISDTTQNGESTTTPAPQGFDRLLSAGFSPADITSLRSQFLAIQSHSHTPETMPTGADLLALEERWLNNDSPTTGDGGVGGGDTESGALEDILYGNLAGFFWPLGAIWLLREEGVWSRRRQIAVLTGLAVNLMFGVLRVIQ